MIDWLTDPWFTPEVFRDITIAAVAAVFVSTLAQGLTHIIGYAVLRHQNDQTDFGKILKRRELSLGVKNLTRSIYDGMILVSVAWLVHFTNTNLLVVVFVAIILATSIAFWYAVQFVFALGREHWGRAPAVSSFSSETAGTIDQTATDMTEVKADVKDIKQRMDEAT